MISLLNFIWQLPQNVIALVYYLYLLDNGILLTVEQYRGIKVYTKHTSGCVTLGKYIFVSPNADAETVRHEYGHTRQSLILGPLYLVIIGIPSILWAMSHRTLAPGKSYYWFYTEAWANRLGQ